MVEYNPYRTTFGGTTIIVHLLSYHNLFFNMGSMTTKDLYSGILENDYTYLNYITEISHCEMITASDYHMHGPPPCFF